MSFLRWGVISALFMVLLVPFVIADGAGSGGHGLYIPFMSSFFPFITGKNFIFRILIEVAIVGYVLLALRDPKYRPRPSLLMWSVLGLFVWVGLATIFSVDPIKSFWSNFERMEGYVTLIHLFAWFVMVGAVMTAENLWDRFFNFAIVLSGAMGFNALMQLMGWVSISSQSGARVDTTFGNATYLAVYMLFSIFITLYMIARRHAEGRLAPWKQALWGITLVLQFAALYNTQTRGALLGAIGGLIIAALWVAIFARTPQLKLLRRISLGALGAIALLMVVFFAIRDTAFVKNSQTLNRLASISADDTTVQSRLLYIWPMALKGIGDKPVLGWGQENFNYVFNANYKPEMYKQEAWFDRAHNQFLDFGIAGGIPALLLYVALFALAAWAIWRSQLSVPAQGALLGLLAGYAFNNLFVFDNLVSFVYFFAILAYLHSVSRKELPGYMFLSRPVSERGLAIAAPVLVIGIMTAAWAINAPGIARASGLVSALGAQGSSQDRIALFADTLQGGPWPTSPLGYQEAVEQVSQFTATTVYDSSIDPSIKQQYITLASDHLTKLMAQRKGDARLELFMGTLLAQYGAYEQALQFLNLAESHSPGKQQILMQIGLTQMKMGQSAAAIETFRKAFEEAPDYDTARILFAGAYYAAGDTAKGDALIVEKWGSTVVDNDQLVTAYLTTKQYSRAAAIWQMRIDKDPKNVELYLQLARVYLTAGDKAKTIAELRKVSQIQPALAGQVEALIKQVENGTLKP